MNDQPDTARVEEYFTGLQRRLRAEFERIENGARFAEDPWGRAGNRGCSCILADGEVFEKAGVNYSRVQGDRLPPAATEARPELAGARFEVMGVSVVVHPLNPYVPTAHCNVRFFLSHDPAGKPVWWFGGGFDLTPYYPFREDVVEWHRAARTACEPFGAEVYPRLKRWCDEYFFIKHRNETRGVGGLFFDDLNEWGFSRSFEFVQNVGDGFRSAYAAIVEKRCATPYGERERRFQLYRRGRYAEFNLVYDRGTLFGLQSQGRTESILMSLPPKAEWRYRWTPEPGSPEEDLYLHYLTPQAWLEEEKQER